MRSAAIDTRRGPRVFGLASRHCDSMRVTTKDADDHGYTTCYGRTAGGAGRAKRLHSTDAIGTVNISP
jgi:hypothetical protein